MKIQEKYVTDLYDRSNQLENLEVKPEANVDVDKKGPQILQSEVEKVIKERRNQKGYRR